MSYAKKVKKDRGSTILSLREQKQAEKKFGNFYKKDEKEVNLLVNKKLHLFYLL